MPGCAARGIQGRDMQDVCSGHVDVLYGISYLNGCQDIIEAIPREMVCSNPELQLPFGGHVTFLTATL